MTRNEQKLREVIFSKSDSKVWEEARTEWIIKNIYDGETSCSCGKIPIKKICLLVNTVTKNEAIVGSSCVEKFIGLSIDIIFKDLALIKENTGYIVHLQTVNFAYDNGYINSWESDFYKSILELEFLSIRQKQTGRKINGKIISMLKRFEQ